MATIYGGTNTCISGGTNYGCGTVFRITPSGTLTTLYNFCSRSGCVDGQNPGTLIKGSDGNLYGTTPGGGTGSCSGGCGTIFKITSTGTFSTLHSFDSTDGSDPAALVQGSDGNNYGTTVSGGSASSNCISGCGTIFKMTSTGTLTTLHSFDKTDGLYPTALVQHTNGTFYGTTISGGRTNYHFCQGYCRTVFGLSVP